MGKASFFSAQEAPAGIAAIGISEIESRDLHISLNTSGVATKRAFLNAWPGAGHFACHFVF